MLTYAHVKWFYGQSERAYYLNYFININAGFFSNSVFCAKNLLHFYSCEPRLNPCHLWAILATSQELRCQSKITVLSMSDTSVAKVPSLHEAGDTQPSQIKRQVGLSLISVLFKEYSCPLNVSQVTPSPLDPP